MRLGINLGYWQRQPETTPRRCSPRSGSDTTSSSPPRRTAPTPSPRSTWYGARTSRIGLGTAVTQISARTPAATAMHALTLDALSGGRLVLGLGASGPQVVEGWYGVPFARPLARTREYVEIMRDVWRRAAPVTSDGPALPAAAAPGGGAA